VGRVRPGLGKEGEPDQSDQAGRRPAEDQQKRGVLIEQDAHQPDVEPRRQQHRRNARDNRGEALPAPAVAPGDRPDADGIDREEDHTGSVGIVPSVNRAARPGCRVGARVERGEIRKEAHER